jgi:hypothetical protein
LTIRLSDILRATMAEESGNEGYIGISPDGSSYHVVVPVDRLLARGLRFWERPTDGTPFGGYSNWRYFPCLTYRCDPACPDEERIRLETARSTATVLRNILEAQNIELRITEDLEDINQPTP